MNDRLKFRFWDKLSNIMTYNFMFGNFMQKALEDYEKKDWVGLNYQPGYICFNNKGIEDNLVIMQCTGKKDCTGKLIYEEDIVTLTGTNGMVFTYVVKFKDYAFVLEYLDGKRARYFHKQYAQPKCLYKEGYRVIGNIYQNPDLLK